MKTLWPCLVCLIAAHAPSTGVAHADELPRAISVTALTNRAASGSSYAPTVTPDGRFVVFVSNARNLTTNDDLASYLDVFLADRGSGAMTLVSFNTNGLGGGNDDSGFPAVSTNGQFVAFASTASNLVPDDTNAVCDVFLRDLAAGTTRLVSVGTNGLAASGASTAPLLSADGRWVIFESKAANVVSGDDNGLTDLFARDTWSNVTVAVSVSTNGVSTANGKSDTACLTPDGRFVAFASTATDLSAADTNSFADLYVRDLQTNRCALASAGVPALLGAGTNGYRCFHPALSADGRFVAFKALLPAATNATVFRFDRQLDTLALLSSNASVGSWPQISDDGRWVASEVGRSVVLWDADAGTNLVVSITTNGLPSTNGVSGSPVMTPDGRRIAFVSAATDLVAGLTNMIYSSGVPDFFSTVRAQIFLRDVGEGTNRLVTVNRFGQGTEVLNTEVAVPGLSADGSVVCFDSADARLVYGDANKSSDVFARDVSAGETQLVSVRDSRRLGVTGAARASGSGIFTKPGGGIAFFTSLDSNLAENDNNTAADLFMRDLAAGSTFPVVANTNGLFSTNGAQWGVVSSNGQYAAFAQGNDTFRFDLRSGILERINVGLSSHNTSGSLRPVAISSDGQRIAFQAVSPLNSYNQIYVRDMSAGTNRLISATTAGRPGTGHSLNPLFTADERWVVFQGDAYDLTSQTGYSLNNQYLFGANLSNGRIRLLSTSDTGAALTLGNYAPPALSADSRYVAFHCIASNAIYRHDLQTSSTNILVRANCRNPSISGDGQLVAFETSLPAPAVAQIVVKNLQTGAQELISANHLPPPTAGNDASTTPQISRDGRFVVFASRASNLVPGDTNGCADIFVRDRVLATTTMLSVNRWGTGPGNGASTGPILSADGRIVVFHSLASDLIDGDYNDRRDVFTVRLGNGDTDGDGMDDDWEMAYFNTLDRDGSGDFDGDGLSDRSELLAGTDPTNQGSVLRMLTATVVGGSTTVSWSAVPGRRYQVQFKDGVAAPDWSDLGAAITAATATGLAVDLAGGAGPQRFYRVTLAP